MIVRDEAHVFARCLRSVRPLIDSWAIVDTGSTDDTEGVARRELSGVPGEFVSCPHPAPNLWQRIRGRGHFDFSKYRNLALDAARESGADYALMIDADEAIETTTHRWPTLLADRYVCDFRIAEDGRRWHRTLLVSLSHPWRFQWPVHEALTSPVEGATATVLRGIEVASYSDSARNRNKVDKYRRDARTLLSAIRDEPEQPRHWFYLGQSYAGAGEFMRAHDAYARRAHNPDGWDEERWYALYQLAPLEELLGHHWRQVRESYLRAFNARPWRAEPLWAAGVLSTDHGEPELGAIYLAHAASMPMPLDSFLVDRNIYEWRAADDLAGCLAKLGRADECVSVLRELLARGTLPPSHRSRVADNVELALAHAA